MTTAVRFVGHRLVFVSVLAIAAIVASLMTPQARSLWFQVLQADAGVTTLPPSANTQTATSSATATETATNTATPTETPTVPVPAPIQSGAAPCENGLALVTIAYPIVDDPDPLSAAFEVRNDGPSPSDAVAIGLRVRDGYPFAQRVDYENGQYWLLEGLETASNLYKIGDLAPGESREIHFILTASSSWQAAPDSPAMTIDVAIVAGGCLGDEPVPPTTILFEKDPSTDSEEPTSTVMADLPPNETSTPEIAVPDAEHLSPIGGNPSVGTSTPPSAVPTTVTPPPTATRTHTPVPATRTPRPTKTPPPSSTPVVATESPMPTVPIAAPQAPAALAEPTIVVDTAAASMSASAGIVSTGGELGSDEGVVLATATMASVTTVPEPSPTATVTAEAFESEVLGSSSLPPVETNSARIGQQRTGYEWIGKMGTTSQLLLLSGLLAIMAMVGGVIVARERERQPR